MISSGMKQIFFCVLVCGVVSPLSASDKKGADDSSANRVETYVKYAGIAAAVGVTAWYGLPLVRDSMYIGLLHVLSKVQGFSIANKGNDFYMNLVLVGTHNKCALSTFMGGETNITLSHSQPFYSASYGFMASLARKFLHITE